MSDTSTEARAELVTPERPLFDEIRLAVASFLARYSDPTRTSYTHDLKSFFAWCERHHLDVLTLKRGHVEPGARTMEDAGLARATIGRRLSTVAGFYGSRSSMECWSTPRPATSAGRRSTPGRPHRVLTGWSSVRSSPRAPPPALPTTPWRACSDCSACGLGRRAASTSKRSPPNAAIARSPCSGRGRSWPSCRSHLGLPAPSTTLPATGSRGHCCC